MNKFSERKNGDLRRVHQPPAIRSRQKRNRNIAPKANLRYWIDDFLVTKRRKWTQKTLAGYTSILNLYAAHVSEDHWPPTWQGIARWLDDLDGRVSEATVHTYWNHVRTFLNYLEKTNIIEAEQNPVHQIKKLQLAPDEPDLPPISFPADDLEDIFGHLTDQVNSGDRTAIRDLALIRFAYVTGCRENEIAQLTLDNLSLKRLKATILRMTSQGKKKRNVYFDLEVRQALKDWLTVRPALPGVRAIFVSLGGRSGKGHAMKPRALYDILQRRCDLANVSRRKFHALRHTSALDAIEEGISLEKIQKQLGHASITTTMNYLRGRDEDRARAYRNQSLSASLSKRADERRQEEF